MSLPVYFHSYYIAHGNVKGDVSEPFVSYASVQVNVGTSSPSDSTLNIHPTNDANKCVGIKGGVYADGTAVDVYASIRQLFFLI